MRKSVYIICVCVLMVLVFYEAGRGENKKNGGVYVPAARLMSQLEKENKQEEKGKKVAYLTFDDGPSYNTEKILDILREKGSFQFLYNRKRYFRGKRKNYKAGARTGKCGRSAHILP